MSNTYFDATAVAISDGTRADAPDVNNVATAVETGFGLLPEPDNIKQGRVNWYTQTGTVNAYTVTTGLSLGSYVAGLEIDFLVVDTNTGASTLNVDGVGAVAITTIDGVALPAAALTAGKIATLKNDGTNFVLTKTPVSTDTAASAASAAAALVSETAAAADLVLTNADVVSTNADVVSTNADVVTATALAATIPAIIGGSSLKLLRVNVGETSYEQVATLDNSYLSQIAVDLFALDASTLKSGELDNSAQTTGGVVFTISPNGLTTVISDTVASSSVLYAYTSSSAWDMNGTTYATDTVTLSEGAADSIKFNSAPAAAIGTATLAGGAGSITGITVGGTQIMSGTVAYTSTLNNTADLVAQNIAAYSGTSGYTAYNDTSGGGSAVVVIVAVTGGVNTSAVVTTGAGGMSSTDVNMNYGTAIGGTLIMNDGADYWRYTSTTNYDISTLTLNTNDTWGAGLGTFTDYSYDGMTMFVYDLNGGSDVIRQLDLAAPFAPMTATNPSISLDINTEVGAGTVKGMAVSDDGLYIAVALSTGVVYRYDLTTANVLTGGGYNGSTSSVGAGNLGVMFSPDGDVLYKQDANGISQTNINRVRFKATY